ncbi:hypothetical protein HS125_08960 [bacterium]|nr:hypothetical protein [bacterium]
MKWFPSKSLFFLMAVVLAGMLAFDYYTEDWSIFAQTVAVGTCLMAAVLPLLVVCYFVSRRRNVAPLSFRRYQWLRFLDYFTRGLGFAGIAAGGWGLFSRDALGMTIFGFSLVFLMVVCGFRALVGAYCEPYLCETNECDEVR